MKSLLVSALSALLAMPLAPAKPDTQWFEDSRFGMFIHFGLYSIPAGVWNGERMTRNDYAEWIRYQQYWPKPGGIPKAEYDTLMGKFNPQGFDADAWIREAKNAGMKYFLITSKHHDGFALWDSKVSDYNVVKGTPFKRDILAELTAACRKHGLKVGFYYSHWLDWEHPGGAKPPWPELKEDPVYPQPTQEEFEGYWTGKCLPQVKELLVNFEPDFLWFDSWGNATNTFLSKDRLGRLISLVRETKPDCLINSRIGTREGIDYLSMGDNSFPAKGFDMPWETSGTLNHSWGYHRLDFKWKPTPQLIRHLVDNTSRGGNYQLMGGNNGFTDFRLLVGANLREPSTQRVLYILTAILLIAVVAGCRWLTRSRFGLIQRAIRDSENRVLFSGYATANFKLFIFVICAMIAASAGALYVPQVGIINPSEMTPDKSLEAVVWVALGGRGTLVGPVIGAVSVNSLKSWATRAYPDMWLIILGGAFVLVVMFMPKGIVGIPGQISSIYQWARRRWKPVSSTDTVAPPQAADP